jgi:hypothetical protein
MLKTRWIDRMPLSRRMLFGLALGLLQVAGAHAQNRDEEARKLNGQHPSAYYQRAIELHARQLHDEATFLFYLGQLRYRTHMAARSTAPGSADDALFASLSEVVGRPINEYAFGDVKGAIAILDDVLAYDAANPDQFTPPKDFAKAHAETRDGMRKFRQNMRDNAADIRTQRTANGLENRTVD